MAVAVYSMADLPAVQAAWMAANKKAGVRAMQDTARRASALYVRRIVQARAIDTGAMMRGFVVDPTPTGAVLTNSQSYFDVIDRGRRPGSPPPLRPILEWVLRKRLTKTSTGKGRERAAVLKDTSHAAEAMRIAQAIRWSIARKGIRPRQIAIGRGGYSEVVKLMVAAVAEEMAKRAGKPPTGGTP